MTTPTTESKLKSGVLTLDGVDYACQATNVRLVPPGDARGGSDDTEVLNGNVLAPEDTGANAPRWTLHIRAVQDFTNASGFTMWAFENDGDTVPYSWKPNASGPTFSGQIVVKAVEIGGDVNRRLFTPAEFECTAKPTYTAAA